VDTACERSPLTASIQPRLDGSTPAGWTRITSSSNPHGSADDGSLATRLFLLCIALNLCRYAIDRELSNGGCDVTDQRVTFLFPF
jgi:hypothetical protein